ncbi:MAG TPA: matrixin family metalloprotease [Gemmataceae bacterium]|nr:matrixin family metalloprotease [Gemmataceae bacterium]
MTPKFRLFLEPLEDRCVPATWGNPWPDPSHLTLSFAPNGTAVDSSASSLFAMMGSNASAWELQILKAFQTWAVNSNINIGVVSDSGASFTAGGAIQGDPRFGDIRIGATPYSTGQLAETSPYDRYSAWSGSTILNSNYAFSPSGATGAFDLFSVMLHEAGHTFGFADSNDTSSVEYQYYKTYTGLSSEDIAALQGLYGGPRHLDQYAGATIPNNAMATAATLPVGQTIQGDISNNNEVEWFKFNTGLAVLPLTLSFRTSGVSLLTAKVTVYSAAGNVIASSQSTDPLNGNLVLTLPPLSLLQTYYVKVSSARSDVFGVGTYQMRVADDTLSAVTGFLAGVVNVFEPPDTTDPANLNGSQAQATHLAGSQSTAGPQIDAQIQAELVASNDYDWYAIKAPAYASGTNTESMLVSAWGVNRAVLSPKVEIFNSNGQQLNASVLTEDSYSTVLQLNNTVPGETYYIRVDSNTGSPGDYRMAVSFPTNGIDVPIAATGTFGTAVSSSTSTLTLNEGGFMHFALSVGGTAGTSDGVSMTIYDANGNVVTTLSSGAGDSHSVDLWLGVGSYRVVFQRSSANTSPLDFQLLSLLTTDPVGMGPSSGSSQTSDSSTSTSSSGTSSQIWTQSSGSYTSSTSSTSQTSYY